MQRAQEWKPRARWKALAAGISREFETDAQGVHRFGALPLAFIVLKSRGRVHNQPQITRIARIEICVIRVICGRFFYAVSAAEILLMFGALSRVCTI
jgi:hypothetical protein